MSTFLAGLASRLAKLFGPRLKLQHLPQQTTTAEITHDHITWAYRLFLDREPENEAVITEKLRSWSTTQGLRADFMTSSEFQQKNSGLGRTIKETIVIKELDKHARLFVDLSDYVIGLGIVQDAYEVEEIHLVKQLVRAGDIVLDIGANIGLFTITLANLVGEHGHVYAFEPLPRNANLLARSIAENKFAERITLEKSAVGAISGHMHLITPRITLNWGGPYLHRPGTDVPAEHDLLEVPIIQLDAYSLRRPIRLIKIDIEGAEPLALRGASQLLEADKPIILSEINPVQLEKVSECSAFAFIEEMRSRGYICHRLEHGQPGALVSGEHIDGIISVLFLHQHTERIK